MTQTPIEIMSEIFKGLDQDDQKTLLKFAEFLVLKNPKPKPKVQKQTVGEIHPRDEGESIVKAITRLKNTYFMLSPNDLTQAVSAKMTEHLIKGKDKKLVIDELEVIFKAKYQAYLDD